jgi:hypothetical protein
VQDHGEGGHRGWPGRGVNAGVASPTVESEDLHPVMGHHGTGLDAMVSQHFVRSVGHT